MANIVRRRNIVSGRRYSTAQGEEKTRWTTIGKIFQDDQGHEFIKLDVVPLDWDGFASIFEEQQPQRAPQPQQPYQQPQPGQAYGAGYGAPNYQNPAPGPAEQNPQGSQAQQPPLHTGAPAPWGGGFPGGQPATPPSAAQPPVSPNDDLPF